MSVHAISSQIPLACFDVAYQTDCDKSGARIPTNEGKLVREPV